MGGVVIPGQYCVSGNLHLCKNPLGGLADIINSLWRHYDIENYRCCKLGRALSKEQRISHGFPNSSQDLRHITSGESRRFVRLCPLHAGGLAVCLTLLNICQRPENDPARQLPDLNFRKNGLRALGITLSFLRI